MRTKKDPEEQKRTKPAKSGKKKSGFVHLHNHTEYSLHDSLLRVEEGVRRAAELGMESFALTDHDSLAGLPAYLSACREHGIKPVVGVEFYFVDAREEYNPYLSESPRQHLLLLAQNTAGVRSLIRLQNEGWRKRCHQGRLSLLDWDSLSEYSENMVCLTGCVCGPIASRLLADETEAARATLGRLKELFGGRLFVELMDHNLSIEKKVLPRLVELAAALEVPTVATNDCHYVNQEEGKLHRLLYKLRRGRTIAKENETDEFGIKSEQEMRETDLPAESLSRTQAVLEMIEPYDEKSLFSGNGLDSKRPKTKREEFFAAAISRFERTPPARALLQSARLFGVPEELLQPIAHPESADYTLDQAFSACPAVERAAERVPHLRPLAEALTGLPERLVIDENHFIKRGQNEMVVPLRRLGRTLLAQFDHEGFMNLGLAPSPVLEDAGLARQIEVEAEYQRGFEWYARHRLPKARGCFQKVLSLAKDADHPDAWYQLGLVHAGTKRHDEAVHCFAETLRRDPDFERKPFLHSWWGWSLYELGRSREALPHFEESVRLHPGLTGSLYGLGLIHFEMGHRDQAAPPLERFLENMEKTAPEHSRVKEAHRMLSCLQSLK